jgi:hypothetical protein
MTVMTDDEVRQFIERNKWSTAIEVEGRRLQYNETEANALLLKFPETPLRATYFARVASLLGAEDESMFYGALLWITLSDIGSPQLEKTGWTMLEMMRRGFGENRPLEAASGHWFRNGAAVELAAFVLLCFVFGWDAYIVPSRGDLFVHISHDDFWAVVTKNEETYKTILAELQDLDPEQNHQGLLREFCPSSRHIAIN